MLAEQGQQSIAHPLGLKPCCNPARNHHEASTPGGNLKNSDDLMHCAMLDHNPLGRERRIRVKFDPTLPWRDITSEGFNHHIGPARFARVGENQWQGMLTLDDRHRNAGGVCHGGVTLSLADLTMGTATFEAGGGKRCATIEMSSHFLAAAKLDQTLIAVATQLRGVRELSFMSCEIWAVGEAGSRRVMRASGLWKYLAEG